MEVFDVYSQYYDLLYKDKNYKKETNYVHSLIKSHALGAKKIVELGSGTGIHACEFARLGYDVLGVDRSKTMLNMANKRKSELESSIGSKLNFFEGDIRTFTSKETVDVVISLFHVMSYMETNDDLYNALQTANKHLKTSGLFIFDCWHGPGVLTDKPISRTKNFENEEICVKRVSTPKLYEEKNTVDVNFDITIENKKTGAKNNLQELHKMRYLFPQEIEELVNENGFELVGAEEWLTKNRLSDKSWNACYICKKK